MFDIVIADGIIISGHNRYRPCVGTIGIRDGKIVYVGEKSYSKADCHSYISAAGKIVMPGLVNGHCHGEMSFAKGLGGNATLWEQMQTFAENNWFYEALSEEDRFYARQFTYAEAVLSGTTTLLENMYWSLSGELSQRAFAETGLRGALAEDVRYDFYQSDRFLTDEMLEDFTDACGKYDLIPLFGTLPEEEFTEKRLREVKRLTEKGKIFFSSHLAETTWRHRSAVEKMGDSPVKVLNRFGLLSEKYIGSHAVYLDEEDIAIYAESGAKIVSTPICELKIADGLAPIPQFVKAGITIALGTDGAMWNNSNDIFREMKCMSVIHNLQSGSGAGTFAPEDILDMATINGAKLFNMEKKLGTIEENKLADLIIVDATKPHMNPLRVGERNNVSSALVYCATGADVTDVIINGKEIVRERELLTVDIHELQEKVQKIAERVIK
ncbi:MAG: amidohydrolase family protein [Hespellia sp.]|nr:amidohydrolase family protein [Hespellia sp.]